MQQQKTETQKYFESLAHFLGAGPGLDVALILHKDCVYFSRFQCLQSDQTRGPFSATVKLIQGLFDQHRDLSFYILRSRIWTTEALGPMNKGMVRLAAKRISQIEFVADVQPDIESLKHSVKFVEIGLPDSLFFEAQSFLAESVDAPPSYIMSDMEGIEWALRLGNSVKRGRILHDHNRPIGAILCDATGKVLSWAVNRAALNKTLHAEVDALQNYFKTRNELIPPGAKLYVSLKPCHMCAGMIVESCEDPKRLEVFYAEDDKGLQAKNTVLDQMGISKIFQP